MNLYVVEFKNENDKFYEFFSAENDSKASEILDGMMDWRIMCTYDTYTTRTKMFNKSEIKYIIQKSIEKEPFMTKRHMLGAIHHTFLQRYIKNHGDDLPFHYGVDYRRTGKKIVFDYHENYLKELYREGFFTYEKYIGDYGGKSKRKYNFYIMKLK